MPEPPSDAAFVTITVAPVDEALRTRLRDSFMQVADFMRNREG